MAINCKRFQTTMFLLCDAIFIDAELINVERLDFLRNLGSHLEWEQAVAHYLSPSRLAKDLVLLSNGSTCKTSNQLSSDGRIDFGYSVNCFLLWLNAVKPLDLANIRKLLGEIDVPSPSQQPSSITATKSTSSDSQHTLHHIFLNDINEFFLTCSRFLSSSPTPTEEVNILSKSGIMNLALFQPGELFDKSKFEKTTELYRKYYEVDHLY